jgi:hypothetical protein
VRGKERCTAKQPVGLRGVSKLRQEVLCMQSAIKRVCADAIKLGGFLASTRARVLKSR